MYLITENEDPPPNVPLSGPPHLLSKSLTKVIILLADSMHNHFFFLELVVPMTQVVHHSSLIPRPFIGPALGRGLVAMTPDIISSHLNELGSDKFLKF